MAKQIATKEFIKAELEKFEIFLRKHEDRCNIVFIEDRERIRNVYDECANMTEYQVRQYFSLWETEIIEDR